LRHERATEELKELAALYALGSLTQHEARSFEFHMKEGCPVCEEEYRRCARAAAGIGLAADEAAAPEYIRDLLSARIEREPQTVPHAVPHDRPADEKPVRTVPPPAPAFSVLSDSGRQGPNILPWVLAAALAVLGLAAAYAWRSARALNTQLQAKVSAAEADNENLQILFDNQKEKAGNFDQILRTVGKPGVRISRLIIQAAPAEFSGAVVWDTGQNRCMFLGNFPPAPEGKTYQLWLFSYTEKTSIGPLRMNPAGPTFATVPVPREAAKATAAVVTLEPENGSQIPTYPYFAAGRID